MDFFPPVQAPDHPLLVDGVAWLQRIIDMLVGAGARMGSSSPSSFSPSLNIFQMSPLKFIFVILALIMIVGIIYVSLRMKELKKAEEKKMAEYFIRPTPVVQRNERWEKVEALFHSSNQNDWRVAIIEADAMLDDLITKLGHPGENLGERLKSMSMTTFPALQMAWEAHKIRNRIAHEGMDYPLQAAEAWHAFKLFEAVFRDAKYI